jgi:Ca2+-binding EF-hand superfamily protein
MKKSLLSILLVSLLLCPTFYAQDEEEEKSPSEAPPRKLKPEGGGGVRAKMIERLKAMDLNADGLVSEEEFQGPEKLFSHLDKNGDGSVDLAKELSGMGQGKGGFGKGEFGGGRGEFGGRGNRPGRGEGMGRMQPIDMSALFDKWDTNGDGILNREEFVAQDLGKTLREMHRQSLMDEEGEGEAFSKRARKTPLASDFVPKYDENKDGE